MNTGMDESIKIFRIENEQTNRGMWYEGNGRYNPFIFNLTEGKSRELPMEYSEDYSEKGFKWFSGCGSISDMIHWFSDKDAIELFQSGYKLYEFYINQYKKAEHEVLFTREGIIIKNEIPLSDVWNVGNDIKNKIIVQ